MGSQSVVRLRMLKPLSAILKRRKYRFDVFINGDSWPKGGAIISSVSVSRFRNRLQNPRGAEALLLRCHCHPFPDRPGAGKNYRNLVREVDV